MMKRWLLLAVLLAGAGRIAAGSREAELVAAEHAAAEVLAGADGRIVLESRAATGGRAAEILERLAAGFRSMAKYEVDFEVVAGEYRARGSYAVEGVGYCLTLGEAEVFCDGTVRYEVDNARCEVTIVGVDTASRNILNNPVRAFDFLGDAYTPELLSETEGQAVVRLTPAAESSSPAGVVTVTVATATMRPVALDYDYDGERVHVSVLRVAAPEAPFRHFDPKKYEGYEFIDFR